MIKYLKTEDEISYDLPIIKRNDITVQHDLSCECGSLCLFVLVQLSRDIPFSEIMSYLENRYHSFPTPPLTIKY